jgi:hypothetical protein
MVVPDLRYRVTIRRVIDRLTVDDESAHVDIPP